MIRPCPPLRWFTLLLALSALTAAETQVDDLRFMAELRPTAFTTIWDDRLGSRTDDGAFANAWAVGMGWRRGWGAAGRPWQVLAGAEAIALRETATGTVSDGQALRLEAGVGWALSHRLSLSLLPMIGYGRVAMTATPVAAASLDLAGPLREVGVRTGLRWSLSDRWSLAAEAGWLRADQRLAGDDATLRLATSGAWAGLALAWTIDPLPETLE